MAIKLYVFESVEDLRGFEAKANAGDSAPARSGSVAEVPGGGIPEDEDEEEIDKPARKRIVKRLSTKKKKIVNKPKKKGKHASSIHCKNCGGYGHFAKTCPNGPGKKSTVAPKEKPAKAPKTKYNPDEIVTLARRVANKDLTPDQAAEKLGVNKAMWYYLRNRYAAGTVPKQKPEERVVLDADEIREKVVEMQETGATSLHIAQKLKIPLSTVNKYWIHDRLAPPTEADVPEGEVEEGEEIE